MKYLHSKDLAHMDIHDLNVLVTPDWECRLVDMGNAGRLRETTVDGRVFVSNIPPEILDGQLARLLKLEPPEGVNREAWDIWSTGVTVLASILKANVFQKWNAKEALHFATEQRVLSPDFDRYYALFMTTPELQGGRNDVGRVVLGLLLSTATPKNRATLLVNLCSTVNPDLSRNPELQEMCELIAPFFSPLEVRAVGFPQTRLTTRV